MVKGEGHFVGVVECVKASLIVVHGTSLHPQLSIDVAYLFESDSDGPEYTVYDD